MHTFRQETRRGAVATIPHRVPSGINHQNRQIYVHTQPQTSPYENPTNLTTPARNSSLTMSSPLPAPHASDYLPSISPGVVYSTAHATWTDQELRFLHDGLQNYPADKYDNVTRYIKIAATIPGKCVRDVAYQVKSMHLFDQNQVSPPPQDRELPIKRMRLEEPEMSSFDESIRSRVSVQSTSPPLTSPPPLHGDAQISAIFQENIHTINSIRNNLLNGKAGENRDFMIKFRDNCKTLMTAIGDVCNTIPPLPVTLDTSLIAE